MRPPEQTHCVESTRQKVPVAWWVRSHEQQGPRRLESGTQLVREVVTARSPRACRAPEAPGSWRVAVSENLGVLATSRWFLVM